MKRHGESFVLEQDLMDTIASYMDDDIREDLHFRIAPCSPDLFLREYTKRDPDFVDLLKSEFSIEMELDTRELAEKLLIAYLMDMTMKRTEMKLKIFFMISCHK